MTDGAHAVIDADVALRFVVPVNERASGALPAAVQALSKTLLEERRRIARPIARQAAVVTVRVLFRRGTESRLHRSEGSSSREQEGEDGAS